jgi:DNA replicative helicase MCM subunit Mcm2 (Cdc46/Mcm family)
LTDALVDTVVPGAVVTVTGVVKARKDTKRRGKGQSCLYQL